MISLSSSEVLQSFRGKRVFITGHTGFKGSWLSLLLSEAGAILKGYALPPDHPNSLYQNLKPGLKMESVLSDIRDAQKLHDAIHSFRPDFIFHLAAQPLVRYSYEHPVTTFDVNVMGTVHVLEALRLLRHSCTCVVVTTDKVYENDESGVPFREDDPLGGHDPYSSSKAAAEIVTQSYMRSFLGKGQRSTVIGQQSSVSDILEPLTVAPVKGIATARAGNVIGGGDRAPDRIIPDLVRALETGTTLQLRNPNAIRPWQHVLDPLAGYLKLAMLLHSDPYTYSGSYNFGPYADDQLSVREIVEMAIHTWGNGTFEITNNNQQPHEAGHLRLDINKAINLLNWRPKWNAKEAVERTVEWYAGVEKGKRQMFESCIDDADNYFK